MFPKFQATPTKNGMRTRVCDYNYINHLPSWHQSSVEFKSLDSVKIMAHGTLVHKTVWTWDACTQLVRHTMYIFVCLECVQSGRFLGDNHKLNHHEVILIHQSWFVVNFVDISYRHKTNWMEL